MRHISSMRLVILAVIILLSGCQSRNKGKIEGTSWSSWATTVKGVSFQAGALKLDFGGDGRLVYRTPIQTFTGTYSLGMADYVSLNLEQDLGGRKNHLEQITIAGNQLIMKDSDGTQVTFDRVK